MNNLCQAELDKVKHADYELAKRLVDKDAPNDAVVACAAKLKEPRISDIPPTKIGCSKNGIQSGCKELFLKNYANLKETELPVGELSIDNDVYTCDVEVVLIIKALLDTGITYDKDLGLVVNKMVSTLVGTIVKGYLYKKDILNCFNTLEDSYYLEQLKEGINSVIKI